MSSGSEIFGIVRKSKRSKAKHLKTPICSLQKQKKTFTRKLPRKQNKTCTLQSIKNKRSQRQQRKSLELFD